MHRVQEQMAERSWQAGQHFLEIDEIVGRELDALVYAGPVFRVKRVESTVPRLVNCADKIPDRCNTVCQPAIVGVPILLADVVAFSPLPLKVLQGDQRNPRTK